MFVLLFIRRRPASTWAATRWARPCSAELSNSPRRGGRQDGAGIRQHGVSLVIGTILGTWLFAGTAASSLARLNLPWKRGIETYLFVVISLTAQMFIVPLFFL